MTRLLEEGIGTGPIERTSTATVSPGPLLGIPKLLYRGQLAASSGTLYTAPAAFTVANPVGLNPKAEIQEIWICNTDSSARTFTLYTIENGGSAADNRAIYKNKSIAANETIRISEGKLILEAGDTIRGLADSANLVTVTISGVEWA